MWNKSDHADNFGTLTWLRELFLGSKGRYKIQMVTGFILPKVQGNRRSATGKADVAIGAVNKLK